MEDGGLPLIWKHGKTSMLDDGGTTTCMKVSPECHTALGAIDKIEPH